MAEADGEVNGNQTQEQVLAAVAQVWEKGKERIIGRVDTLEQAIIALLEGSLDQDLRRTAEREAHKLAGSLTTFGFPEGSRLARDLEQTFQGDSALEQVQALHLSEQVLALRRTLEQPTAAEPSHLPADTQSVLLVIDDDRELTERLAADSPAKGVRTEVVTTLPAARQAILRQCPDVVLLNLSLTPDLEDSLILMDELAGRTPPVPVLVRSLNDGFIDRVEVARSGGRGFLPKTLPPAQLLDVVANVLEQRRAADAKVLAVDDDPEMLSMLKALLGAEGIEVSELADPLAFWSTLEEVSPDLLILDLDMPHANGMELCQMVRNDPRWSGLPVLFLTGYQDPETVRQLFQAGADDYIVKPILGPELVTRVLNRLERTRLQRSMAESDPLTGLANRHKSGQGLLQYLGLAHLHSQPLCLALLDLDDLKGINIRYGHAGGDQIQRRLGQFLLGSFRSEDLVGRWDGAEFVVGMYGMTREDGVQRLVELLETVRGEVFWDAYDVQFRATFSAGVAQYPEDGEDLPSLYRSASEALSQAKAAGGNRVLPAGWQPGQNALIEKVDVVLVDDDETLSSLLLHTLENRGYSTRWLQDGLDAVEALGGQNPTLKAKLVLLDVDLPGMDGLGVLRRLAREGVTQRTRIIMLTLRATEEEVLASLELGAFDHVGKPFSVPVLMQRIKRAIEL